MKASRWIELAAAIITITSAGFAIGAWVKATWAVDQVKAWITIVAPLDMSISLETPEEGEIISNNVIEIRGRVTVLNTPGLKSS